MKRFLIGLGAVAALFVMVGAAGMGFVAYKAYASAEQNRLLAVEAVRTLSEDWSPRGKENLMTTSLYDAAHGAEGQAGLKIMSRLGKLVSAEDVSQIYFGMDAGKGTSATITFKGRFSNGTAVVTVRLQEQEGFMKVLGVSTSATTLHKRSPEAAA